MSEKESPESSSGSGESGGLLSLSTPTSKNSGGDATLVVRRQPPKHVFSEEWFEVEFALDLAVTPSSPPRAGDTDSEFIVTLHHTKTGSLAGPDVAFNVDQRSVWFSLRGSPPRRKQRVRCQIQLQQIRRDRGESFWVKLSPKDAEKSSLRGLVPVSTQPITVVNHKIKVDTDSEWGPVWYKDEGGRDKCMTVIASLFDNKDQLYTGEEIPLQLTLYYATESQPLKVTKQDILKTLGVAQRQQTDKRTGKATLRFRIDDVSKNHQGQDFRVEVAPDSRIKGFRDVAPGFSPPVAVRSKRNKRQRGHSGIASVRQDQRLASPHGPRSRGFPDDPSRPEVVFSSAELPRVRDAVKGVMQWADEVVTGLYPLQWQVLGYHQNPDGSPDYNRPYHNIPNPNAFINHILAVYGESTRDNLRVLSAATERPGSGSAQDQYAMPHMTASPREEEAFEMPAHRGHPVPSMPRDPYATAMHAHMPPQDAYRDKPPEISMGYPPTMRPTHSMHLPVHRPPPPPMPRPEDMAQIPMHPSQPMMHAHSMRQDHPATSQARPESRESEVAYVLGTQYKAFRSRERLGFPAYSRGKELLGFYRDKSEGGQYQFVSVERYGEHFGPLELIQATELLDDAINSKSETVYDIKDWGSISNLLDNATVYAWTNELGPGGAGPGAGAGGGNG